VAYEVMLIGSYGMMMVGARPAQLRETMKYLAINAVASTLFVVGCGLLYAAVGTLNMADVAERTAQLTGERAALVTTISMLFLIVFAMKAAAFPLFFWLPDSYPVVPPGVNGFFAGLLTKVGVYSLLRVFVLVFRQEGHEFATEVLLVLSGLTMVLGVLGAMCQWEIRKILSWHIISQVGYMVMGIGLASNPAIAELAVAGTIFYVVHHIIVKANLFLIGGIAGQAAGSQELKKMGGVLDLAPSAAGLFLVSALSLAGMPPFSGFLSKFVLVRAGLSGENYVVVAAAIVTSFLTLFSMAKIWTYAFWGPRCHDAPRAPYRPLVGPAAVLAALTIVLGLWAQPVLRLAGDAARNLIDPREYVAAVLVPAEAEPASPIAELTGPIALRHGHRAGPP
jgi:multicomponent Na+:H+ antiporter subunit D